MKGRSRCWVYFSVDLNLIFQETGSLIEPGVHQLASLAGQQLQAPCSRLPQYCDYRLLWLCLALMGGGERTGGPNSGLHRHDRHHMTDTLLTESTHQPPISVVFKVKRSQVKLEFKFFLGYNII